MCYKMIRASFFLREYLTIVNNSSSRPMNKTFLREVSSEIERKMHVLGGADLRVKRIIFGANAAACKFDKPFRSIR